MAREYKKIFETDKSKPTYHFLPIQQVPILSCPECSSIKASMCADCGTFMCTNLHKTNPQLPLPSETCRYYYYDNKKGQVKEGHDPTCQKQNSAETNDIQKETKQSLFEYYQGFRKAVPTDEVLPRILPSDSFDEVLHSAPDSVSQDKKIDDLHGDIKI